MKFLKRITNLKEINVGKKTVTTEITYSYMPYGRDNYSVVVQTTTKTKTTYNYQSHWETFSSNVVINLNGFFENVNEFKLALPTLAEKTEEYADIPNGVLLLGNANNYKLNTL